MKKFFICGVAVVALSLFAVACDNAPAAPTSADEAAQAPQLPADGVLLATGEEQADRDAYKAIQEDLDEKIAALREDALADEENGIVKALATNGQTGYAYETAFQEAYDGYTSDEINYLRANDIDEFVYVPLYDEAMENVIGEFEINIGGGTSVSMKKDGKVFVDGVYKETIALEDRDSVDLSVFLNNN